MPPDWNAPMRIILDAAAECQAQIHDAKHSAKGKIGRSVCQQDDRRIISATSAFNVMGGERQVVCGPLQATADAPPDHS
jgi:hypothetical protein